MGLSWVGRAAHPPWAVSEGMGGGGAIGGVQKNRPRKKCGGRGNKRSGRESAVDESRKEMADRAAIHQTD